MTSPSLRICSIWHCIALVLVNLFLLAPSASAQDASIVSQTWRYFLDRCGLAYSDPQRYVDEIAAGRAPSAGNVALSPDGQILLAGTTGNVLHDTYTVAVTGNRRVQSCYVMGLFDGSPESSAQMNAAFLREISKQTDWVLSGGLTSENDGFPGVDSDAYRYAVLGPLPDPIVVKVIIGLWVVEIFSIHIDTGNG
ncbi:MAG: hypothetical protein ACK4RZ_00140 [Paracoccaceae bacterium]